MHPWFQTVIDMCTGKFKGDLRAFNEDPLGRSLTVERHCFGEFSMANVQANEFMEDQSQVEVASNNALFLGVYDGHGGFHASQFIIARLFQNLLRNAHENGNTITEDTLKSAVADTEKQFIDYVRSDYIIMPALAKAGSCCLAGVIWKKTLHVANLGDSRAIIASMVDGKLVVEQLTRDHNCNDAAIREELRIQYPDDPEIVFQRNGSWRVKGIIEVCRTIGDAYLKRPDFTFQDSFPRDTNGPGLPDRCVLSSVPEMYSRDLRDSDKFLIFASDGLWDFMSNEQAAEIVSRNPRNGIAKRLLSVALMEAARRRGVYYKNIQSARRGRGVMGRRSFHDDISVIVVFLEKRSFLRRRLLNVSYIGSSLNLRPPSDFAKSELSNLILNPLTPRRLRASLRRRSKSVDSPRATGSSQGEDTDRLIDQGNRQSRWASLREQLFGRFRR